MDIHLTKGFRKMFRKLPQPVKEQFKRRRDLFLVNQFDLLLNNHQLQGEYVGYRSINITGDYRVIFELVSTDVALFIKIGTHSELYD